MLRDSRAGSLKVDGMEVVASLWEELWLWIRKPLAAGRGGREAEGGPGKGPRHPRLPNLARAEESGKKLEVLPPRMKPDTGVP